MISLLIALFFSLAIMVTFKVWDKKNINIIHAITVNYLIASISGFVMLRTTPSISFYIDQPWLHIAFLSGTFFFLVFNVFALSAQKVGVAITAVSSKMSVIIPVILGSLIFGEKLGLLKTIGVILAMFSFYLIFKKKESIKVKTVLLILPLLLFFGNGINDSLLKYTQFNYINSDIENIKYLTVVFSISLIFGLSTIGIKAIKQPQKFELKNIIAGVWLGICNWLSTLYFLKGLGEIQVSVFIPVFNAGLVSLAAMIGLFFFKEKLSRINIIGIFVSIIAITIIALSNGKY